MTSQWTTRTVTASWDGKMGGVAIWVPNQTQKTLQVEEVVPRTDHTKYARRLQEIVWAQYKLGDKRFLYLASVHIPSDTTMRAMGSTAAEQVDQLNEQIKYFARKGDVIVGGDFNLQRTEKNAPDMQRIMACTAGSTGRRMRYMSCNVVTRPQSGRKIDHIITTLPTNAADTGMHMPAAKQYFAPCDHDGIGTKFRLKVDIRRTYAHPQPYQRRTHPRQKLADHKRYDAAKLWGTEGAGAREAITAAMHNYASTLNTHGDDHTTVYSGIVHKLREVLGRHIARAQPH
eukprot:g5605.t1